MKTNHLLLSGCAFCLLLSNDGAAQSGRNTVLPLRLRAVLNSISPDELKGELSFLASDTLGGRFTPSPGLEVAAEFIASKFRAAGLQPGGDQGYFQTAKMVDRHLAKISSALKVGIGSQTVEIEPEAVQISRVSAASSIRRSPLAAFPSADLDALKKSNLTGKTIVYEAPDFAGMPQEKAIEESEKMHSFGEAVASSGAALEIILRERAGDVPGARLISASQAEKHAVPVLIVRSPELLSWLRKGGDAAKGSVTVDIPAPEDRKVTLKNVVGVLRGSDPQFKDSCVLLTAHYDHIGTIETGKGMASPAPKDSPDRIYNGANDDGSGTVSVIEIARALAQLTPHPKRSIVFMTFFGEERGELGSQFYADHPVFPLVKTVADVNLEQVGRTDSTVGKQVNTASLTGYDYSGVTTFLEKAGRVTGIKVYKDAKGSDAYFTRSDNSPLARKGVPAHTLTVAFDYSDYHGLGDEWPKVDYDNMARVDRMVALGLLNIANDPQPPAWNVKNEQTAPFREARERSVQIERRGTSTGPVSY